MLRIGEFRDATGELLIEVVPGLVDFEVAVPCLTPALR
jgi:hypothetical protein